MATSILGKRSRNVIDNQDTSTCLAPSNKRARRAVPSIYEDKDEAERGADARSTRSKTARNAHQKKVAKVGQTTKRQVEQTHSVEDCMDIENIPPTTFDTPTTIRYKDFLNLQIPKTPRHLVRISGTPLTPRSSHSGNRTSRTQSAFSAARQLFTQSCDATRLVGREAERQQIRDFISHAIDTRTGGCTYVSGPPGTGKSALVGEVFREFEKNESTKSSVINCVSLQTANVVYNKLLQDFSPNTTVGKSSLKQHLSKLFLTKAKGQLHLILLDEIDNLLDVDCDVLYTIFEWAMHKSSSVVLIGIANALDLTDRFLPRLKVRGLKPNLLPFLPYTASQISTIITDKLCSLLPTSATVAKDFVPFMQSAAIQLCGKKIASQTGDLRKAFSLVRRIIDQVEQDTINKGPSLNLSKKPLVESSNIPAALSTPDSSPLKYKDVSPPVFTPETAPRATIAHAAKVASTIFNNSTLSRLSGLNLQQKAVLCSLVSGEKRKAERNPFITPSKSANKIPSVKDLFIKYSALCKRDEGILHPLKDTEFRDVVASLETLGLVHEHRGRTSSLLTPTSTPSRAGRNSDDKQIVSAVSEKEMRESLCGAGTDLLKRLLDGD